MCSEAVIDLEGVNPIPSEPLCCAKCGGVLRIVCDGPGDCPPPLGPRNQVGAGTNAGRTYQPKPCVRCTRTFQPTGSRAMYCGKADCVVPS